MPEPSQDKREARENREDPLAALREHVHSARQAAERLARDASAGNAHDATRAPGEGSAHATPPNGWASPEEDQARAASDELQALVELVRSLRELLPDELRAQLIDLIRQLLVVARALVDVLIARLEHSAQHAPADVELEDITID
ncbi:MAG TPA: hypothetical protein VLJ42_12435 [Solirubrobacteraceae bacterium]|nr:hypothetical protein [Solirubrobacteraceae bacterium]